MKAKTENPGRTATDRIEDLHDRAEVGTSKRTGRIWQPRTEVRDHNPPVVSHRNRAR